MKRLSVWSSVGALVAVLGYPAAASAVEIKGTIGFSGSVILDNRLVQTTPSLTDQECGGVIVNPTCGLSIIDFVPTFASSTPAGSGVALVVFSQSGFFAGVGPGALPNDGVTGGTTAQIFDLTNDVTAAGAPPLTGPAFAPTGVNLGPVGVVGEIQKFSDLDAAGLHFDLTTVINQGFTCTGFEAETPGTSCAEGPFVITRSFTGIHVDFDVLGFFRRGPLGCVDGTCTDEGFFQGIFGTDFNGLTFAELFKRIDRNGLDIGCGPDNDATVGCTFSGNFKNVAPIPEPMTLLTFGLGSAALAQIRRRRNAKK